MGRSKSGARKYISLSPPSVSLPLLLPLPPLSPTPTPPLDLLTFRKVHDLFYAAPICHVNFFRHEELLKAERIYFTMWSEQLKKRESSNEAAGASAEETDTVSTD